MSKKTIIIYSDWEEDIKMMTPPECQNFILNIFRNARNEQPYLPTRAEQMHWLQIQRILNINKEKYDKRCKTSSENGKKGGAPQGNSNAKKQPNQPNSTQNNLKQTKQGDK